MSFLEYKQLGHQEFVKSDLSQKSGKHKQRKKGFKVKGDLYTPL